MTKPLIIIKQDERFFNAQHNTFSDKMCLASWYKNRNEAIIIIANFKLENAVITEIEEDDFYAAGADNTTRTIIACEVARTYIKESLDIITGVTMYAKHLRNALANATNKLKIILPHIEDITTEKEDQAYLVLGLFDDYIRQVSSVDITDMERYSRMFKAMNKDPKSIDGIVNKILK